MRLQVAVRRHALPTVNIVFTTGTGPESHTASRTATVADLLHDISDIIPLECDNTEWGLEDYVVSTTPKAQHNTAYECLHFQTIESVLRDGDEIEIRPLSSHELKLRRLNGRHQVTSDGRHLVDGLPFGRPWLRRNPRPDIIIPPRKRLRLEDVQNDNVLTALQAGHNAGAGALALADEQDDEDDEDEDFVDDDEEDSLDSEYVEDEELSQSPQRLIMASQGSDDAEQTSEDGNEGFTDNGEAEDQEDGKGELGLVLNLPVDVHAMLQEAAELQDEARAADESRGVAAEIPRRAKRKRESDDEGLDLLGENIFEGFSTPAHRKNRQTDGTNSAADSRMAELAEDRAARQELRKAYADSNDTSESDATSDSESFEIDPESLETDSVSASSSGSDSMEHTTSQLRGRVPPPSINLGGKSKEPRIEATSVAAAPKSDTLHNFAGEEVESSVSDSTSLVTSDSESESEPEIDSDLETDSDTDSDSLSTSSSSSSDASSEALSADETQQPPEVLRPVITKTTPPGQGTKITHRNNERGRKKRRLQRLKSEGFLPDNANFEDLAAYDKTHPPRVDREADGNIAAADELERRKQELLQRLEQSPEAIEVDEVSETIQTTLTEQPPFEPQGPATSLVSEDTVPTAKILDSNSAPSTLPADSSSEPQQKRARLDTGSSRRLIFGALGLRNPKTPAAEQALRDRLSRPTKTAVVRAREPDRLQNSAEPESQISDTNDAWKTKLIVSAVECSRDDLRLPPPPFPFRQSWSKGKQEVVNNHSYHETPGLDRSITMNGTQSTHVQHSFPKSVAHDSDQESESQQKTGEESRTISFLHPEDEQMPVPDDFEPLVDLQLSDITQGTIIAYKELHIGPNFQPEESPYRTARVLSTDVTGIIRVVLSQKDRPLVEYDEETGEKIYSKFEMPTENEDDNGERELDFRNLIRPKLVEASSVQVSSSNHVLSLRGGDIDLSPDDDDNTAIVPESVPQNLERELSHQSPTVTSKQVEVSTPRRNEINTIMKEAGFDSALAEGLLQPLATMKARRSKSPQPRELSSPQTSDQQLVRELSTAVEIEGNGLDAKPTGWESSPVTNGDEDKIGLQGGRLSSSFGDATSPEVSLHDKVVYPMMPELSKDSVSANDKTNSSSHQDAQRVPSLHIDLSFGLSDVDGDKDDHKSRTTQNSHVLEDKVDDEDHGFESLRSEIPQSQEEDVDGNEISSRPSTAGEDSFLGRRGSIGHESSYHDEDDDDLDDDLPSLKALTSSQIDRSKTRSRIAHVSAPPLRQGLRNGKKRRSLSPLSSEGLSSSQPFIKLSQSQQPSLSQIPSGTPIVDLTFSSDPVSPGGSDSEYRNRKTKVENRSRVPRASTPKAKENPFAVARGLGNRKLLTTKKWAK